MSKPYQKHPHARLLDIAGPVIPWRETQAQLPDDEITVLGFFGIAEEYPVWPCWHDGEDGWRDAGTAELLARAPRTWCHLHEIPGPITLLEWNMRKRSIRNVMIEAYELGRRDPLIPSVTFVRVYQTASSSICGRPW